MRILSADDKAENLYMLEALLRGHGHIVDSASNGLDALSLAERGVYDLVISDVLMPRMDGFQLCREMKKDDRLRHIPFILYTATYTDPRDAAFALSVGADRFLVKPLEPEVFIREVEEVVARKTPPPPQEGEIEDESIYLKEYNARLVAKIEKKMLDLEVANRLLQEDIAERERSASERHMLEEQLRQAQKLEAIGTLAGGIAHDFNNILAGILGFADLGLQECGDPRVAADSFREILRAGGRARDLVRQILTFSRHGEQDRQPLDLEADVRDALKLLRAALPASVELLLEREPGNTPRVLADHVQVHQVVTNLVTNAWHAIGDQPGQVRLQLSKFQVDADFARSQPDLRPGRYVRLTISDNGCGMDAATIGRIFEPFFTTKEPGRGTGLGLSAVHGIMKSCDGAISVYSEPGTGTSFQLYFPALDFDAPTTATPEPPLSLGKGENVLFIEDEPALAALGQRFLTRLGYTPVIESDAIAAVALFRDRPFDLVITDLTMPQLSGIDVARKVWEIRPGTRVILTTGYSATLDSARAREIGFRELLLKPYSIQALGDCVQRACTA